MSKMIEVTKPSATIHASVVALARSIDQQIDGGVGITQQIMDLVLATDLGSAAQVEAVCADLQATIEDEGYAAKICSIVRNARAVAFGGTRGRGDAKVTVAGKGVKALDVAMDGATGLNDLAARVRAAKPAALQQAGAPKKAEKKPAPKKAEAAGAASADRKTACAAAISILRQVENYLSPGADARMIGGIEAIIRELELYRKAA